MEFLNPYAFLFLIFLPLFFKKNNKKLSKIILYSSKNYFFLIAYLFLIIAFSRPVINNGEINVRLPKTNVIIAIDSSSNMLKKDFYPNNLEFVKNKVAKFLNYLKNENVAILLFNQNVYMLTPYSRDYNSIKYLLSHISKVNSSSSPNFKKLFEKVNEFKNPKVLVLFTSSPILEDVTPKIRVFVDALRDDITLKNLAQKTKGAFVKASYSNDDIANLAKIINSIDKEKTVKIKDTKELFYYPLFLAILFIFFGLFKLKGRR